VDNVRTVLNISSQWQNPTIKGFVYINNTNKRELTENKSLAVRTFLLVCSFMFSLIVVKSCISLSFVLCA